MKKNLVLVIIGIYTFYHVFFVTSSNSSNLSIEIAYLLLGHWQVKVVMAVQSSLKGRLVLDEKTLLDALCQKVCTHLGWKCCRRIHDTSEIPKKTTADTPVYIHIQTKSN